MSNVDTSGLPVEMQQRIADIIAKAQASVPAAPAQPTPAPAQAAAPQPAAPVQRPPSLMDHTIALRQEVMALREELNAASQVIEAVGQAVGQLYARRFKSTDRQLQIKAQRIRRSFQQQVDTGDDY